MYGPVPSVVVSSFEVSASACGLMMCPGVSTSASVRRKSGFAVDNVKRRLSGPVTSTCWSAARRNRDVVPALNASKCCFAFSAVSTAPSENFTPGRSVTSRTVLPSPTQAHFVARAGFTSPVPLM
jgi:hypothetical protein